MPLSLRVFNFFAALALATQLSMAETAPVVTASLSTEPITKAAAIGSDHRAAPGFVSILALSVATITLVRRRRLVH